MKKYLPNKSEIAMFVFGIGLGITMTMPIGGRWSWMMLFFWPILFIVMPLVYIIGKRKEIVNEKSQVETEEVAKSVTKKRKIL